MTSPSFPSPARAPGYTTTCGTEGNLLGILYGREKLPEATLYCSRDSHYSVPKAGKLYRIPTVCSTERVENETKEKEKIVREQTRVCPAFHQFFFLLLSFLLIFLLFFVV